MKTMKMALLPLLLIGALSGSWYYFSGYFSIAAPPDGATGHSFNFAPPPMDAQKTGQSSVRDRLIFLNFDDGRFALINAPDNNLNPTFTVPFRSAGNVYPYAESTEVYTDKKPPQSVARMAAGSTTYLDPFLPLDFLQHLTVTSNQLSSLDLFKITMTTPIQIAATRRIVPESGVTYIVTIENGRKPNRPSCGTLSAAVTLNFDPNLLVYISAKDGHSHTKYTPDNNNPSGPITINLSGMVEGEQRSLVYVFKTKDGVTAGTYVDPEKVAKASVLFSSAGGIAAECAGPYADTISDQNVVYDSHDPNHKIIIPDAFCINESKDLTFRVDFQNDGLGPTQNIVIEDELDFLYASGILASQLTGVKAYLGGVYHSSPIPEKLFNDRKFKFSLNNAVLNGTHQEGYGIKFSDASTKGFLEFKIHTDDLTAKPTCNAICNQAKIFFDCNPAIITNTAFSKINCLDCSACSDTLIKANDNGPIFIEGGATIPQPIIPQTNAGIALKDLLTSRLGAGYYFKWYPASMVTNPGSIDAKSSARQPTTYTLVASSSPLSNPPTCRRIIYQRTFTPNCNNLSVTTSRTTNFTTGCPAQWKYTINAQASGFSLPENLTWAFGSKCQAGGSSFSQTNVGAGIYKVIVTDNNTGCTAEATVDILAQPIIVDDNPSDCMADLIVAGGTPPYTYQWQWDGQMQTQQTGSQLNSLSGKSSVVVTVTDANGCKKVFYPKGNCQPAQPPNWSLFSLLGLGLTGLAYWLYKRRNRIG